MDVLRNCYDPEIPVNIVDLGLVYGVAIENETVKVRMTLTAMGCPASAYLSHQVKELIEKIPGVKHADVDIVWDPPWTPDKMSAAARERLQSNQEPVTIEFDPASFKPRKKGHIAKNPDGTIVLINETNSRYLGNDDIASLWEKSDGSKTIDELTSELAVEKKVSPAEIRMQILEVVTQVVYPSHICHEQPLHPLAIVRSLGRILRRHLLVQGLRERSSKTSPANPETQTFHG
jgi:metal-sulfur cluster biosynthetic enzyme